MRGQNGIKVTGPHPEYSIAWLKDSCIREIEKLKNLEDIDMEDTLLRIQEFTLDLANQMSRILSPIQAHPSTNHRSKFLSQRFKTVLYPVLYTQVKPVIANIFRKYMTASLISNTDDHIKVMKDTLSLMFHALSPLDISKALENDFIEVIQHLIEELIKTRYNDVVHRIPYFMSILGSKIDPILKSIFSDNAESYNLWKQRFEFQMYRTLGFLFIESSFDIFRDYPETEELLKELKICLERSGEMKEFVRSLISQLRTRLLIVDAHTKDILYYYLLVKKCMSIVTNSAAHRLEVLNPIKSYLQGRENVVRDILLRILSATEPDSEDLLDEGNLSP
jgi:hypothetical protein